MIYLNENGGRQEIWIPLKGKANGYNGTTAPLYEEITENGEYVWDRSNGFSPVTVKVDVPQSSKVDLAANGIKLSQSTFSEVPDFFDFSNCTDMSNMFENCTKLTSVPDLGKNRLTATKSMFRQCFKLTSVPMMDTSEVSDMDGMFSSCESLTEIPQLDMGKVNTAVAMFQNCLQITTIPQLDFSNVNRMSSMFQYCSALKSLPKLDTGNVEDMGVVFNSCSNLETIAQLDVTKVLYFWYTFSGCSSLTSLTLAGPLNANLELKDSPLNEDSIKSVLTAASKTTNTTAKTLSFKEGSMLKDSDGVWAALISECTGKGWTIQNLTLA